MIKKPRDYRKVAYGVLLVTALVRAAFDDEINYLRHGQTSLYCAVQFVKIFAGFVKFKCPLDE